MTGRKKYFNISGNRQNGCLVGPTNYWSLIIIIISFAVCGAVCLSLCLVLGLITGVVINMSTRRRLTSRRTQMRFAQTTGEKY